MRSHLLLAGALIALTGSAAFAQYGGRQSDQTRQGHTQFDDHDQQVARDWYHQQQGKEPVGLRTQDRLSADEESRLREGAPLDKDLRKKVHSAPADLTRRLPPPPSKHRYVAIGGHIGLIDNNYQLKSVIHLEAH